MNSPLPSDPTSPALPNVPSRPPLNRYAVAALVSCALPLVGIALGATALSRIERTGERGKGMATTGLLLSSLGTLVCAVALAIGAYGFPKGLGEGAGGSAPYGYDAASLRKGDCIDTPDDVLTEEFPDTAIVSCVGQHTAEVFGVFQITEHEGYPGDDSLSEMADSRCWALGNSYAMDSWALPVEVVISSYTPSREGWEAGDRQVTCLFVRHTDAPLKGSLRRDETMLDDHQVAYLKAANTINDVRAFAKPEAEYVKDDLKGYKEWAHSVSVALDEQARLLRGHEWPATAKRHVAALQREIDAARPHWARAADARDVETYYDHYEAALHRPGHDEAIEVRTALGLTTSDTMPESFA
ncbi:DUF4190 domain-containing protein [Streptomyces sp. NPDC026673]|uniref:DUF4190 domain-containing protein n=1 Tax=Streptomyces sp. NPDC026673 TaxID=3155724 RepID=UPI0033E102AF